jgi:hypothetical protein
MELILIILAIAFLVGLLSRQKGDGFLDTISSGCGTIVTIVIILIIILLLSL